MNDSDKKQEELKLLASPEEGKPAFVRGGLRTGKADFFIEIALIFVLGILIGIAVKTEAVKRITMGYNDYQIKIEDDRYSISQLEKDLIKNQGSAEEEKASVPAENSSSENISQ
jgi:hypothetical protein